VVRPEDVLGPEQTGASLALIGDAGTTNGLRNVVQGVDVLVSEATYLQGEADMARQFSHLTATQSARLARDAGVHQLVLTHISRRYRESDVLEEARGTFPNTTVARDFDHYRVLRQQVELEK
jgi:ribonuclease Z